MNIARATPGHAPVLAALHAAGYDAPWSAAEFAALLGQPGVGAWIASADEQPAAFILIRSAADEAEILTLVAVPEHRRHGFAARLVREACSILRAAGTRRLFLEVAADNTAARALYERCGFAEHGRRKGYYRAGRSQAVDAVLMALTL